MPETAKGKSAFVAVFLSFIFFATGAQSLKDYLQKGDRFFSKKDYDNALRSYKEALALDAGDALTNYKAGISGLNSENFSEAVEYLETAFQLNPDVDPDIDYYLGVACQENHEYSKARKHFENLKEKNKRLAPIAELKLKECIIGDSLMKLPALATVTHPEGKINTSFSESSPLISSDGQLLIFTSNRSLDEYEVKSGRNSGDVYISQWQEKEWGEPQKISENINVKSNESATSLSADGRTLFLCYEDGGGDIYTSTFEKGGWSAPVPLNRFVNHPQYRESAACVSADGKRLYFSSNRPGGKGGFDIYVCKMGANGQWGRPANLGSAINTRRDEVDPYLHTDDKTLYFSSNGQATLGDYDIFKSTFENEKWGLAENLGYPINTSAYEGSFVLSKEHHIGYFTSRRRGKTSGTDIFTATFTVHAPVALTPDPGPATDTVGLTPDTRIITVLKGSVIDATDAKPLQATISLVDNSRKEVISKVDTDPSGNFQLNIPYGGNFGVTTEKAGYLFNSMNFNLPAFEKPQQIDTHVLMVKAKVGSKVILKNIFFDTNQSHLKRESLSELENVRDLVTQNPQWRVQINGHTDNVGHQEANRVLSLKRAQAVVDYLIAEGIPSARLQAKGFGPDKPIVSNDDEKEGRQINRRTEIEIVE